MRVHKKYNSKRFTIALMVFALIITNGGIILSEYFKSKNNIPVISNDIVETKIEQEEIVEQEPQKPVLKINLAEEWQELTWYLCQKNNLSYETAIGLMHKESRFDLVALNRNKNSSYDSGLTQVNNRFEKFYIECATKYCEFDPNIPFDKFNPDHSIRAGIGGLVYYRDYWRERGVSEEDLFQFILNSFNMGIDGFERYIRNTGTISRSYDREIYQRKVMLERDKEINEELLK